MHKSIRKSLYLCAAALMIGGVAAPTMSNTISVSAHTKKSSIIYNHKKNVRNNDVKRLHHLQNIHKYHLSVEAKDKRNLANHRKSLAHYNHLIRVHKHNRKMINNLTRAKNKLIKMINNDQRGITRQAKLVESEEHQISLIKHAKPSKKHNNGNYGGKRYSYWYNLGKHSRRARGPKGMNHWENRAFIAGYNSTHHKKHYPASSANPSSYNPTSASSAAATSMAAPEWTRIGYDVGLAGYPDNSYGQLLLGNKVAGKSSVADNNSYIDSMMDVYKTAFNHYNKDAFESGFAAGNQQFASNPTFQSDLYVQSPAFQNRFK